MSSDTAFDAARLQKFFTPESVAVLGASSREGSIGWRVVAYLQKYGYQGKIYPINPKQSTILNLKAYPSILDVKEPIDLAYIALASENTIEVLGQCEQAKVKFIILISAGFAETGADGKKLQRYVTEFAKRTGIRVLGPNCQGAINFVDRVVMSFSASLEYGFTPGSIGIVSQSGATGHGIYNIATERGMGMALLATTGNEADLGYLDFLEYMLGDPLVKAIAGYVEGSQNPKRLFSLGQESLVKGKPIILLKTGKSEASRKAVSSHTAVLADSDRLFDALLKQAGIIRVNDIDELLDAAYIFSDLRLWPAGKRVGIISTSGGAGVMLTDACSEMGLDVVDFQPETIQALTKLLPSFATAQNPLDMTAQVINDPDKISSIYTTVAGDPNVDILLIGMSMAVGESARTRAEELRRISDLLDKPLLVAWVCGEQASGLGYQALKEGKVPVFQNPARCVRALKHVVTFANNAAAYREHLHEKAIMPFTTINDIFPEGQTVLAEHDAKQFMAAHGFATVREKVARTVNEAIDAANEFGYPVALKIHSPQILHKTESGGVKLKLRTADEVAIAFEQILANVKAYNPDAEIKGILVQEMIEGGEEIILGSTYDPLIGPVVMFGLGGIYVELAKDVAFRVPPITKDEALGMIAETKMAYSVLKGARGKTPGDIDALCETVSRFSCLVSSMGAKVEIDLNPIIVLPEGKGVKIVDALIVKK